MMDFTLKVSGDATGGWIAEIHDGNAFAVYRPFGSATPAEAAGAALGMYFIQHDPSHPAVMLAEDAAPPVEETAAEPDPAEATRDQQTGS